MLLYKENSKEREKLNSGTGWGGGLSDLGSDVWPCRRNSYRKASSPPGMVPKGLRKRDSKVEEREGNRVFIFPVSLCSKENFMHLQKK